MKWIKINESTDSELVNDEESGSRLYEIGLWWGSGYTLDMYRAYAFSEEEALNYVVAYIEKTHPKWLESSDECAHEMMKEYDDESPEFQETFMYVDATSEGADEPHYIWSENLSIRELNSVRESIRDGFKTKRINKMNKQNLTKEEVLVIDKIMHEAKITDYFKLLITKTGRQYFWNSEDSERLNIRDGLQYICNTTLYGFDFAFEFGLTQQEIDTWNAMIDRFGLSDEFKAENFKEREILHTKESTMKQTMKKLNITKEQFNRSRYFKNKYGTLKYVSESGKVYKTSKGKLIRFNERNQSKQKMIEDFIDGILQREFGSTITSRAVCYEDEDGTVISFGVNSINVQVWCQMINNTPTYSIECSLRYHQNKWIDSLGDTEFENRRKVLNLISFLYNNFEEIKLGLQKLDACNNL